MSVCVNIGEIELDDRKTIIFLSLSFAGFWLVFRTFCCCVLAAAL